MTLIYFILDITWQWAHLCTAAYHKGSVVSPAWSYSLTQEIGPSDFITQCSTELNRCRCRYLYSFFHPQSKQHLVIYKGNLRVAQLWVAVHCCNLVNSSPKDWNYAELDIFHKSKLHTQLQLSATHNAFAFQNTTLQSHPCKQTSEPNSEGVNLKGDADLRRHKQTPFSPKAMAFLHIF